MLDIASDDDKLEAIFFSYASRKQKEMKGRRFVHYTSAEAAASIIERREIWLRKSLVMVDFMEVEYGLRLIRSTFEAPGFGDRFRAALDVISPNIDNQVDHLLSAWTPNLKSDTYLACVSEHNDSEDQIGRLSMWRSLGGATGVALVVNSAPFLTTSDALKAYSSPVAYLSPEEFRQHFTQMTVEVEKNVDFLKSLQSQRVVGTVFNMLRAAALCTKHPGFGEELEWRIIHSPTYQKSDKLIRELKVIKGVPQLIYRLPLKDYPQEGFVGAEIPALIDRVIIGPSRYPYAVYEAFVELLSGAGVQRAREKVFVSDIPLVVQ